MREVGGLFSDSVMPKKGPYCKIHVKNNNQKPLQSLSSVSRLGWQNSTSFCFAPFLRKILLWKRNGYCEMLFFYEMIFFEILRFFRYFALDKPLGRKATK